MSFTEDYFANDYFGGGDYFGGDYFGVYGTASPTGTHGVLTEAIAFMEANIEPTSIWEPGLWEHGYWNSNSLLREIIEDLKK